MIMTTLPLSIPRNTIIKDDILLKKIKGKESGNKDLKLRGNITRTWNSMQ